MQEFLNRVIHGDCSEIMGYMPDECVDLTVTSPPYDDLRSYKGYSFPFEDIAQQLFRVTKQGGIVVWIVGDKTEKGSETLTSFKQALFFKELGFNIHDTMIYEKNSCAFPDHNRYYNVFEYMFVLSKGKPKTVNRIEDRKNIWGGTQTFGRITERQSDGTLRDAKGKKTVKEYGVRNNIWRYNTGKGQSTTDKIAFEHPAIFPEKLAQDHILSWSNECDIVFDPMCGSGTTLKMAYMNNRNFIGVDYSAEYVQLSQKRLEQIKND
jgi:DNA modification methylase